MSYAYPIIPDPPSDPAPLDQEKCYLTRAQAAKELGVSVWTVDSYRAAGRLTPEYLPGKTRPIVVYTRQQIEGIKTEQQQQAEAKRQRQTARNQKQQQQKKEWSQQNPTFSVRLSAYHRTRLEQEAKAYGVTPAAHARGLIRWALESELREELKGLKSQMLEIERENKQLRKDLQRERRLLGEVARVLMEYGGLPESEALLWVERNILRAGATTSEPEATSKVEATTEGGVAFEGGAAL